MSEAVDPIARLAKFTPAAGGLDRDAVVFAAGRASVRHGPVWPALAGALALSWASSPALAAARESTTVASRPEE